MNQESEPPPPDDPQENPPPSRIGCLFGVLGVLVLGALLATFLILPTYRARSWPETQCTIDFAKLESRLDSEGYRHYTLRLRYTYQVAGQGYASTHYALIDTTGTEEKKTIVHRLRPGTVVPCYYDPADPGEAILVRDYVVSGWLILLAGLPVLIIGIWLLFYLRQQQREAARPARDRWRIDALPTGSLQLRPRRGHAGRILLSVAAAATLSAVAVFVHRVLPIDAASGTFARTMISIIVYLLAALAGAATLAVIYSLLRAIGPRLRLVLPADRLRLGAAVELEWHLGGVATAVRSLHMILEGREEHGRQVQVFWSADLRGVESAFVPYEGTVTLAPPADTMHSFDAGDRHPYRIVWVLRVRADVTRWPDFDEVFELTVLPGEATR